MKNATRSLAGYGFLALGVAGVMLPVMPGIPFLIAAVALLGHDHRLIRPFHARISKWTAKKPATQEPLQ